MPAELEYLSLPAPHEGLDVSVAPHQLPRTKSFTHHNFLTIDEGRVSLRGGALYKSRNLAGFATDIPISATPAEASGNFLISYILQTAVAPPVRCLPYRWFDSINTAVPDPPTVTFAAEWVTSSEALNMYGATMPLFVPGGVEYVKPAGWGYVMDTAGAVGSVAWGGRTHICTHLYWWQSSVSFGNVAFAPRAGQAVAVYGNRLWVLGGTAPGTVTPLLPNSLWYTNIGVDPATAVGSWQTNGVNNQIVVGSNNTLDWGIALAPMLRQMLVLKKNSIWRLVGTSEDTWTMTNVSSSVGCVDARAVVTLNDNVYWLAGDGLKRYDGTAITHLSGPVDRDLVPAILLHGSGASTTGSFLKIHDLGHDQIMVHAGDEAWTVGASLVTTFCGVYNTTSNRWSTMDLGPTVTRISGPELSVRVADKSYAFSKQDAYDLSYLVSPQSAPLATRFTDTAFAGSVGYSGLLRFAPVRASSPRARAHLSRFGLEHYWQKNGNVGNSGALSMQLYRYGQPVLEPTTTLAMTASTAVTPSLPALTTRYAYPLTQWAPAFAEATDFFLQLERGAGVQSDQLVVAEVLSGMIEYQHPTHRRA